MLEIKTTVRGAGESGYDEVFAITKQLNDLGEQGWELVAETTSRKMMGVTNEREKLFIFKRPRS